MWGNLPNEILNLIVNYCGSDCLKVEWMFVNRKWFDFYLSLEYKSISLALDDSNKTVQKIIFSPFEIGNKVECIKFITLKPPDDISNFDISNDCLSKLMKQTPNVEKIEFSDEDEWCSKAWAYLTIVLQNTNYWKLRVLPKITRKNFSFSFHYYLCAYRMRHTLKELDLNYGIVGALDFEFLIDFTELECLKLYEKLINNVNEITLLLRHTPKLKELAVYFTSDRSIFFQDDFNKYQGSPFLNLKNLTLYNFTPKDNSELIIFISRNFMLDKLHIIGDEESQWPAEQVDSTVADTFFDSLKLIHEYEITKSGTKQGAAFMKWLESINASTQKIRLEIVYVETDIETVITIKGGKSKSVTTLVYKISHDIDRNYSRGANLLNNMSDNVFEVEISDVPNNIELLLSALIRKEQVNLEELTIANSFLDTYSSTLVTALEPQCIKNFKFYNCKINLNAFNSFMKEFKSLDHVQLDSCLFKGDFTKEFIDMPDTIIGTMNIAICRKLFYSRVEHNDNISMILLHLVTENYEKYYIAAGESVFESTRIVCELICTKFNAHELFILNIQAKSIKQLLLRPKKDFKDLKFNFPQWH